MTFRQLTTVPTANGGFRALDIADAAPAQAEQAAKGFLGTKQGDSLYGKIIDNSITRGIQKLFPGEKAGQAIGTAVGLGASAIQGNSGFYDTSAPSPMRVIGDAAEGALSIAGLKGAGMAGGIAKRLASNAALGAGMSASSDIADGGSISSSIKAAGKGAASGLAVGTAGEALSATLIKGISALPERLIRSAVGQSKKELLAGKDIAKYVLENKKVGTAKKILEDSQRMIDKADDIIRTNLKSVPIESASVDRNSIISGLTDRINAEGGAIGPDEVIQIIAKNAPQAKGLLAKEVMTLEEANVLRQALDKTLGDRGFLAAELPFNKDVLKSFSNIIREEVKSKAPQGTRAAFNTLAKEITLRNALAGKVAQGSRNQIISFGDLFGAIPGSLVGGVPGAIAGAAARRAVQSTPVLTGSAVILDRLTPIIKDLAPATRTAILKAISDSSSQ